MIQEPPAEFQRQAPVAEAPPQPEEPVQETREADPTEGVSGEPVSAEVDHEEHPAAPSMVNILATPVQNPKPVSSMMSLLVEGPGGHEEEPKAGPAVRTVHTKTGVATKPGVVIRRSNAIIDVLHHGATAPAPAAPTPTPTIPKKISPSVQSRKISQNRLPEWQSTIATTFLLTPDMSCTDENVDMSNPEFQGDGTAEMDQITEETTRCICNSPHESEVMIQCDSCKKWLHEDCVRLLNSKEADPFICIFCQHEMAKAVRAYVRRSLAGLAPILQRCQTDYQTQIPRWSEITEIVKDTKDVLKILPLFLPTADDAQNPDA